MNYERKEQINNSPVQWYKMGGQTTEMVYQDLGGREKVMQLGVPEDLLVVALPQFDVSTMIWLLKGQILQATYVTRDPAFSIPQFDSRTGEKGIAPAIQRLVQEDFLQAPSGIILLRHPLASISQYSAARDKLIGLVNPVLEEGRRYPVLPVYPSRPPLTP